MNVDVNLATPTSWHIKFNFPRCAAEIRQKEIVYYPYYLIQSWLYFKYSWRINYIILYKVNFTINIDIKFLWKLLDWTVMKSVFSRKSKIFLDCCSILENYQAYFLPNQLVLAKFVLKTEANFKIGTTPFCRNSLCQLM